MISDYGYDATLHAFDKSAGKLGVDRIDLLLAQASVVPAVNQVEVHPYFQQTALQRLHDEHGIVAARDTVERLTGFSELCSQADAAPLQSHRSA